VGPSKILGLLFKLNQFELVCRRDFSCFFYFNIEDQRPYTDIKFPPERLILLVCFHYFSESKIHAVSYGLYLPTWSFECLKGLLVMFSWRKKQLIGTRLLVQEDFVSLIISAQRGIWCSKIITKTRAIRIWFIPKFWFDF